MYTPYLRDLQPWCDWKIYFGQSIRNIDSHVVFWHETFLRPIVQFRSVLGLELTLQNIKFSSDFRDYNVQATFFSNRKSSLVIFPLGKDKVCKRIKWPRFCPSPWAINIIINANLSFGHLRKHKHFHLLAIFCIYEKCFPV